MSWNTYGKALCLVMRLWALWELWPQAPWGWCSCYWRPAVWSPPRSDGSQPAEKRHPPTPAQNQPETHRTDTQTQHELITHAAIDQQGFIVCYPQSIISRCSSSWENPLDLHHGLHPGLGSSGYTDSWSQHTHIAGHNYLHLIYIINYPLRNERLDYTH